MYLEYWMDSWKCVKIDSIFNFSSDILAWNSLSLKNIIFKKTIRNHLYLTFIFTFLKAH